MTRRALLAAGTVSAALGGMVAAGLTQPIRPALAAESYRIPDVEVWSHNGRKARFYEDLVRGRVVTINVMYTACGDTCPLVTQNLRAVQELLGDRVGRDLFMYSITLQPELETPEILADYAAQHEVGPGWEFLTGAPADITRLRRALGYRSPDPEADVLLDEHTGMLRYGNDALDRWAHAAALLPPETIVKAMRNSVLVA